jgi:hypothetical protein
MGGGNKNNSSNDEGPPPFRPKASQRPSQNNRNGNGNGNGNDLDIDTLLANITNQRDIGNEREISLDI